MPKKMNMGSYFKNFWFLSDFWPIFSNRFFEKWAFFNFSQIYLIWKLRTSSLIWTKKMGEGWGVEVGQISLWKSRTSKTTIFAVFRLWSRIDHQNYHRGTLICHFVLELVSFSPDWTPKTAKNLEISWKITNYKNINFDDKSLSSAS